MANHPDFNERRFRTCWKVFPENFPSDLPSQSNFFIDISEVYPGIASQVDICQEKLRRWTVFLASARHCQQKIFLAVNNIEGLWLEEARVLADLIINTQGVSKDRRHLSVLIEHGGEKWKRKILLTEDDFVSERLENSKPSIFGKFRQKSAF
ncbi:MAG: hypothetical protein MRERV_25c027 [Mycoplasmataceae bacterium RV_VA103A]|nr:MAG: hypothetical protein MRERV_25c027 [Mycoplasmataceae bacterium RV_VA103A]